MSTPRKKPEPKKKIGRPKVIDPESILAKLERYIDNTDVPIVAEFAYLNNINRQRLYEEETLSDAMKKLIAKKEAQLERLSLSNQVNVGMAIFSLKQLGWSDRQTVHSDTGELDKLDKVLQAVKGELSK